MKLKKAIASGFAIFALLFGSQAEAQRGGGNRGGGDERAA